MASLQIHPHGLDHQSYTQSQSQSHGPAKITKSRSRPAVVRPILKKLQSAHAERRSLDLDRAWDEQQQDTSSQPIYTSFDYGALDLGGSDNTSALYGTSTPVGGGGRGSRAYSGYSSVYSSVGSTASGHRSVRDVSFTLSSKDVAAAALAGGAAAGAGGGGGGQRSLKFSSSHAHARSISGTSHASVATSTTSGRNSSFVHPFQQTPRTSTPPLSYANSVVSLDNGNSNNTSSASNNHNSITTTSTAPSAAAATTTTGAVAIPRNPSSITPSGGSSLYGNGPFPGPLLDRSTTITEDGDVDPFAHQQYTSVTSANSATSNSRGGLYVYHDPRQPSAVTQRTSFSDGNQAQRAPNLRSNSGPVQRIVSNSVNQSYSELQPSSASSAVDTPLSTSPSQMVATPSLSSPTPLSPLRNSLDMSGFRIRSRSEVDTVTRQEQVREARRKFEAKEKAKEEKYTREQTRKRERSDNKEAQRSQTQKRKGSFGTSGFANASLSSSRNSSSIDARRPTMSRKSTGTATFDSTREKVDFASRGYDSVHASHAPGAGQVQFETPKRRKTAKRKTTGVWTAFMLWLRTRLLHVSRN